MAKNTTTFTTSPSNSPTRSKRVPYSFHRPAPTTMPMMMPTNRKRKEVVEPSSYKPHLSLLRDRDKLLLPRHHPVLALEQGRGLAVLPPKCRNEFRHQFKSGNRNSSSRPTCCSISSHPLTAKQKKTNGYSNSANNCPMTLLKYFSPCTPFFFLLRLHPETACPCLLHTPRQYNIWTCNNPNAYSYEDDKNNSKLCKDIITKRIRATTEASFYPSCNNSNKNNKKFSSILISVFMCFVLVGHIIQVGHASPLSNILPTQTTTIDMEYSGNTDNSEIKYFDRPHKRRLLSEHPSDTQDDDEYRFQQHHQLFLINNATYDGGGGKDDDDDDDDDGVKEMKDETNGIDVNITKDHPRGRNIYSGSSSTSTTRSKNGSKNGSGNQLEFASLPNTPRELTNNSNSKNKNMELWNNEKGILITVPLAVKKRTEVVVAPSSSSLAKVVVASTSRQEQRQATSAHEEVTNDLSQEMKESSSSSSENNGDDESSFILINKNNNDNNNKDSSDSIINVTTTTSTTTLGKCWTISVDDSEEMRETKSSPYYFLLPLPSSHSADPLFISTPAATPTTSVIGLMCNGTSHLEITLSQIPETLVNQVISIVVKDSLINTLDLSLFHRFPRVENVTVTHSNITQIVGTCPEGLKALNISFNHIRKLNNSIFSASGSSQGYDDEYDEDIALGESHEDNLEESNNDSDNIATNFSTEFISSYFASSAERVVQEQKNKSDPMLELLSLSPSPSSSSGSSSTKKIRDNSKHTTDHYSKKLTGTSSLVHNRTKKLSPIPFLTNEEKQKDLEENSGPSLATILGDDNRHHHHHRYQVSLLNKKASSEPRMGTSLEIAETNESNADYDDSNDDEGNEDGDDNLDAVSKKYNDSETNNRNEQKNATNTKSGRRVTPTASGVDFAVADKEANIDCAINKDSLCKSVKFVRKSRQVTRDVNERFDDDDDDDNGNEQTRQQSHNKERRRSGARSSGILKNDGYLNKPPGNVVSERQAHYHRYNPHPSILSFTKSTATSIVNNQENDMDIKSTNPKPTLFSGEKRFSNRNSTSTTKRKRKPRTSITTSSTPIGLSLEDIDLSHNKISVLPRALLQLKGLKSLRLSGNQLKCDFVWEKLADWYMKSDDDTILKDGDDTFCGVVDDVRVFQFTVLGVLKAKKDLVETCRTVDKNICHECALYSLNKQPGHGYNLSHQSAHGNVAIALKLDCSFRNLSDLPAVPPQTWQLNVSGNAIKDLIPLKDPMYENLLILDADSNEISTLDGLTGTTFLDRYNVLSVQNNRLSVIPSNILSSLKNMRGQGVTFLGANFIDCDCDVVKDTKPLLLENSKQIRDLKEIYCKDMKTRTGETYMAVKDLQYTDLCYMDSEESNEMYLYLIIFAELLLISLIVAKVWYDQRTFRRTGILPWFSAKMPRLPCDAMLESVKEPPHNRSSSTNVRSYACEPPASISSCVQLREVRSNSGHSEKSSQISQLSSFPCSSRTSSV